jgi:hypothetical protein
VSLARHYPCWTHRPLYSKKLHMRVRRARTSCETSLTILALSLGARVVNHLARRWRASVRQWGFQGEVPTTLPCRESKMRYLQSLVINNWYGKAQQVGTHFIVMVAGEKRCRCDLWRLCRIGNVHPASLKGRQCALIDTPLTRE